MIWSRKKIFFYFLLLILIGCALYPKQILLKCVAWKASSYCEKAFGAALNFEALAWERGKIVFKNGELHKEGEMDVVFENASLIPFFNIKQRIFGGELTLQGLKIVHQKKELRPVPNPPSPSFKIFTLRLDTTIESGELFLYDYLSANHFFHHICFDLVHHVYGKQTCGTISFDLGSEVSKCAAHFKDTGSLLELAAHFQSHSFPNLAHLITYFFQNYLPEPAFHWDILQGTIDGDLDLTLVKGAPFKMQGELQLSGIQGENPALNLLAEVDHLSCLLDIDFSKTKAINGELNLCGGRLALQEKGVFWEGIWDLKNIHSKICFSEGKVESSTLTGSFMGMEGALILDWQLDDVLMQIEFQGFSNEMQSLLPEKIQKKFRSAFPDDYFLLNAKVKRAKEGLELVGDLAVTDPHATYCLAFGCLLGAADKELELEPIVPEHINFSLSRSVNGFLDCLKQQFCLSHKRLGWFHGDHFPLEKFVSPFLLHDKRLVISGVANFKGTFDDRYLVVFYEGRDFNLEDPHFRFHADSVKENALFGVSAVHYIDLKTWNHVGFLPLQEADYWQKNYGFHLEKTSAIVNFENQAIHIQNISTQGEGIDFEGNVHIHIQPVEGIDLKIAVERLKGPLEGAQRFLAHFAPSFFWQLPIVGEITGDDQPLLFHYHFSPTAALLQGKIGAEIHIDADYPLFSIKSEHSLTHLFHRT